MLRHWYYLALTAAALLHGCAEKPVVPKQSPHPKTTAIEGALLRLLQRTNDDAFVIVQIERTENWVRYVQFANQGGLLLDVPQMQMSEPEKERARRAFAEMGGKTNLVRATDPQTRKPFSLTCHQVRFDDDCTSGANAAIYVLRTVFLVSDDEPLAIEEN